MERTDFKFANGSEVRCKLTGFIGKIVCRTEFINGCKQYGVIPKAVKNKYPEGEEPQIDEQSLELIKKPAKKEVKETGGRSRTAPKMWGR